MAGNKPEPKAQTTVTKTPIPEGEKKVMTPSPMVQLNPTTFGNEMTVAVQMLSAINKNLAFIAKRLHDFVVLEESKTNGGHN